MKRIKSFFTIFMSVVLLVCNINIIYASDSSTRVTPQESVEKSRIIINEIYNLNDVKVTVDTIRVLYDIEINPTYLYFQFKGKGCAIVSRANMELIVYDIGCEKNPLDNISSNEMIVYGGGFSFYKYEGSCLTNLFDNVRINVSEITQEQKQINKKILAVGLQLYWIKLNVVHKVCRQWVDK